MPVFQLNGEGSEASLIKVYPWRGSSSSSYPSQLPQSHVESHVRRSWRGFRQACCRFTARTESLLSPSPKSMSEKVSHDPVADSNSWRRIVIAREHMGGRATVAFRNDDGCSTAVIGDKYRVLPDFFSRQEAQSASPLAGLVVAGAGVRYRRDCGGDRP